MANRKYNNELDELLGDSKTDKNETRYTLYLIVPVIIFAVIYFLIRYFVGVNLISDMLNN